MKKSYSLPGLAIDGRDSMWVRLTSRLYRRKDAVTCNMTRVHMIYNTCTCLHITLIKHIYTTRYMYTRQIYTHSFSTKAPLPYKALAPEQEHLFLPSSRRRRRIVGRFLFLWVCRTSLSRLPRPPFCFSWRQEVRLSSCDVTFLYILGRWMACVVLWRLCNNLLVGGAEVRIVMWPARAPHNDLWPKQAPT